jgi:hypothetical protein
VADFPHHTRLQKADGRHLVLLWKPSGEVLSSTFVYCFNTQKVDYERRDTQWRNPGYPAWSLEASGMMPSSSSFCTSERLQLPHFAGVEQVGHEEKLLKHKPSEFRSRSKKRQRINKRIEETMMNDEGKCDFQFIGMIHEHARCCNPGG